MRIFFDCINLKYFHDTKMKRELENGEWRKSGIKENGGGGEWRESRRLEGEGGVMEGEGGNEAGE
jgi:hypothetical protein